MDAGAGTDPPAVVSLGSVNVDRVIAVDETTLDDLAATYEWFPAPGETVRIDASPQDLDVEWEVYLGGKGANQAVAAAAAGATATFLGAVGEDDERFRVTAQLRDRGVDVEYCRHAAGPTGTAYVFVAPDGENHIAIRAGANAAVDPAYARANTELIAAADALLLQNEIPVETAQTALDALAERPRAERPLVVLDPAPADGVTPLLSHRAVDVVTPNEHEASVLSAPLADVSATVVETRGPDPVRVRPREGEGEAFTVAPPAVDPVDTTGAGDVFAGYLAACRGAGESLRRAVETAAVAAALSTEREGVQPAVPDAGTVRRFLDAEG